MFSKRSSRTLHVPHALHLNHLFCCVLIPNISIYPVPVPYSKPYVSHIRTPIISPHRPRIYISHTHANAHTDAPTHTHTHTHTHIKTYESQIRCIFKRGLKAAPLALIGYFEDMGILLFLLFHFADLKAI